MSSMIAFSRYLHQLKNRFNQSLLILHSIWAPSGSSSRFGSQPLLELTPQMLPHLLFVTPLLMALAHLEAQTSK